MKYFHTAEGYPVKDTWLTAIKAGNYTSWPGLTLTNATKYCPSLNNMIKGHIVQTRRNVRLTKRRLIPKKAAGVRNQCQGAGNGSTTASSSNDSEILPPDDGVHCLHVETVHHIKLYTDDTGHFLTRAKRGNHYVIVAYHSSNVILV